MNKKTVVWVTSVLCLLPALFSAGVYALLPQQIAIHWNSAGAPDSFVHKAVAAFGFPVFFLAVNLASKLFLLGDPKGQGAPRVIRLFSVWLIPALSVILVPVTLFIAMGADIPVVTVGTLFIGLVLLVTGNYLPKSRQNYTIGIKLPWTLHDADNWNKTHRLAGYLWMAGGLLLIVCGLVLPGTVAGLPVTAIFVAVLVLVPVLYSYTLYARGKAKG